jgi:hypothetical protein
VLRMTILRTGPDAFACRNRSDEFSTSVHAARWKVSRRVHDSDGYAVAASLALMVVLSLFVPNISFKDSIAM